MPIDNHLVESFLNNDRFKIFAWLIHSLEGFKSKLYKDIAGNATIGYGHEIIGEIEKDPGIQGLHFSLQHLSEGLQEEEAQKLLIYDLMNRANIDQIIEGTLPHHVWASLTCFCFNIGEYHFKQSDAFKLLKDKDLYRVADSMASWRNAEEKFSEGIAKRRLCEVLVLLDKSLDLHSSLTPSQQFKAPSNMHFMDDNWSRLSSERKREVVEFYKGFKTIFPS